MDTMRWRWEETVDRREFVEAGAEQLDLQAGPAAKTLVVAKSLGCYAAECASVRGYPAVWLTPVLTDDFVMDALGGYSTAALLVGGSADRVWDADRATGTGLRRLEVPGADHGLQLPDWRSSIAVLQQTLTAINDFALEIADDRLTASWSRGLAISESRHATARWVSVPGDCYPLRRGLLSSIV